MATIGSLNIFVGADTAQLNKSLAGVQKQISGFVKDIQATLGKLGVGLGVGTLMRSSIDAFVEQELATAKLNAVLNATGAVAGVSSRQIDDLAASLQRTTRFADETVVNAAAIMATFRNINADIFPTAIRLAADLAETFDLDLATAARTVGKALDDPAEGLGALGKMGVRFTNEQEKLLKTLTATGHLAEAQGVILDALKGKVSGVADEIGKTAAGQIAQFKNALNDLGEEIGKHLLPDLRELTDLLRFLKTLSGGAKEGGVAQMGFAGIGLNMEALKNKPRGDPSELFKIMNRIRAFMQMGAQGAGQFGNLFRAAQPAGAGAQMGGVFGAMGVGEAVKKFMEMDKATKELTGSIKLSIATFGMSAERAAIMKLKLEGATDAMLAAARAEATRLEAMRKGQEMQEDFVDAIVNRMGGGRGGGGPAATAERGSVEAASQLARTANQALNANLQKELVELKAIKAGVNQAVEALRNLAFVPPPI